MLFSTVDEQPEVVEAASSAAPESSDPVAAAAAAPKKSFKSKPKGLPLSDFKVGDSVKGKVKSVTAYGAFVDIGAETDALLHISNLSVDYVANVKDVLQEGQEYEVRIMTIDEGKKQVALTLLTEEQQEQAVANAAAPRPPKRDNARPQSQSSGGSSSNRRDDSPVLKQLKEKGWDDSLFVTGTVISTLDFGAFVRIDASHLNPELASAEFDGLVHISALANRRVNSVADVCKVGDEVKVRVKSIEDRKVSLTMVTVEDEAAQAESRGSSGGGGDQGFQGNKDWKEALETLQKDMPMFSNRPMVVDNRKK
jgi:predicted RNA-binding protein with RPS1 domain